MISRHLLFIAGLGTLLAGCQVRDDDPYAVRERQLEARVDRVDQVFKNQTLEGLSQRIDEQQQQIQQLRGEVEVLEHDSELDKKQQRDLYQDLDKRLQRLEMGMSGSAAPAAGTVEAPASTTGQAASAPAGGADEEAYQKSFNLLKQGRFSDAVKGFKTFLKKYPQSSLASNAEFWTGEAYYQTSDFDSALVTFRKVLKNYPKSNKVPDATLKVGLCQYELQQWQSARQTLTSVVQNFPNTSAASQAAQRLQRMQDEGH
ncbi:MAG TPA: tol-pal system protein YbgF [Gammaproteobacteria bacterium]|nr:tol-pal system protein YbgF [Gammaproteobacteria bacterium]